MRVIMGKRYEGYEEALKFMRLDSLKERREKMALKFAKKSLRQDCRSLDRRTSDPMLDLCSRQQNRSTFDRLTPRVLEMNSKVK